MLLEHSSRVPDESGRAQIVVSIVPIFPKCSIMPTQTARFAARRVIRHGAAHFRRFREFAA